MSSTEWLAWLGEQAKVGADMLNVAVVGPARVASPARTLGTTVRQQDGTHRWMRVTAEKLRRVGNPGWYGNAEANAISGVPRPHLLTARDWDVEGGRARAELMTLAPSPAVSTDMTPPVSAELRPGWWQVLRHSLRMLSAHPTSRVCVDAAFLDHRIHAQLGVHVDFDEVVWNTAHGDLHWGNLTAPECWLLDWESWGTAPAGYDAALLLVVSLTDTSLTRHIHRQFQRELDSPSGRIAQLAAAAKILELVERGRNPQLERPARDHAERVLHDCTRAQ